MSEVTEDRLVTKSEMDDFITGLFETKSPKADPSWKMVLSDIDTIGTDVELVSAKEVTSFIKDLFEK